MVRGGYLMIDKNYEWFEENKKDLLKKYKNEYVVITEEKVVFNSEKIEDAITFASELELGTFIIQKVERNEEPQVFHTRVII